MPLQPAIGLFGISFGQNACERVEFRSMIHVDPMGDLMRHDRASDIVRRQDKAPAEADRSC